MYIIVLMITIDYLIKKYEEFGYVNHNFSIEYEIYAMIYWVYKTQNIFIDYVILEHNGDNIYGTYMTLNDHKIYYIDGANESTIGAYCLVLLRLYEILKTQTCGLFNIEDLEIFNLRTEILEKYKVNIIACYYMDKFFSLVKSDYGLYNDTSNFYDNPIDALEDAISIFIKQKLIL